jgi:hypothetical protein
MDIAGQSVTAFLESLQDVMQQLGEIWSQYVRHGTQPGRPVLNLAGPGHRALVLALIVKGSDGRECDLGVEVLWNPERWTIKTEAWVEVESGQELLRELPERTTSDLDTCIEHIRAAVGDLASFKDLVPGEVGRGSVDD